jgi:hypothetical protein
MVNRRDAMTLIASSVAGIPSLVGCAAKPPAASQFSDSREADRWMQSWIESTRVKDPSAAKAPNGALHVGRFADPIYFLTSVIGWNPEARDASAYQPIRVPVGFVTDFASIPRAFWSILRPDGLYSYAAIIHDYLYWEQFLSRNESDSILKRCMEDFRIDAATITTVYGGVRVGGGFAWDSNAKLKASGERRILKKFPENPTIRWDDWKKLPDVFKDTG